MPLLKPARVLGTAAVLTAIPLLSAIAQTQPAPTDSTPPPAATKPETSMPPAQPQISPSTNPNDRTAAPAKVNSLVGLSVMSSDGSKLGTVRSASTGPDGTAAAIFLKTGGFLGFGGKVVSIPAAKFTRKGDVIQVGMTADEVSQMPEAKEQI
jgi:sporulation protein YlmC with PRC-barrel domain